MPRFRNLLAAFFVLLLLSACAGLSSRFQKPEISLVDIRSLSSGNLEQRFSLTFRLLNPNDVLLPIRGMSFDLRLQDVKFASGATPENIDIPAFSEQQVSVEVSTNLFRAGQLLFKLIQNPPDQIDYGLEAKIRTSIPLLGTVYVSRSDVVSFNAIQPN